MLRRLTFLLSPRWLMLCASVVSATIAMVLLGRWQLHRAHQHDGGLQNYSYVLQWWAFSVFVVFMLGRVIRDAVRQRAHATGVGAAAANGHLASASADVADSPVNRVGYRRYVPPTSTDGLDAMQRDYNDYLASLDRTASPRTTHDLQED